MKCESKNGEIKVMNKIAIMTDSNSGITQKEAERLGIRVLPMPVSYTHLTLPTT